MILLLLAMASDPDPLLSAARAKLSARCEGAHCAKPADARFRIADEDDADITAKDRAIGDTGAKCNVVGARLCTRQPRTIFRTGLGR